MSFGSTGREHSRMVEVLIDVLLRKAREEWEKTNNLLRKVIGRRCSTRTGVVR